MSQSPRDPFKVDKVSLSGAMGAMLAIASLLTLLQIRPLRWFLLYAVGGGALFGVLLAWLRRR